MATTFTKLISLMAYDNALTERTDDYYLRAKTQPQTLGIAEIARETAALLGKYGEDEIALILNKAEEVKCEATASGYIISTPFCLSMPGASGTVLKNDLSKPVDRNVVKVYATLSQGIALRKAMAACKVEIFTQPAVVGPLLNGGEATTRNADGTTRAISPGQMMQLTGRNLKLAGTDASVGILFTSVESPSTTVFIARNEVSINEPTRLMFVLPTTVVNGSWHVRVTSQYSSGGKLLKTPRSYELDSPVLVGSLPQGGGGEGGNTGGGSGGGSGDDGDQSENPLG